MPLLFLAIVFFGINAHAKDVYVQDFNGDWPYGGWTDYIEPMGTHRPVRVAGRPGRFKRP